jgi:hypothetical protein
MYIQGGHDIREGAMDSVWMLDVNKLSELGTKTDNESDKKCHWVKIETTGKDVPGI